MLRIKNPDDKDPYSLQQAFPIRNIIKASLLNEGLYCVKYPDQRTAYGWGHSALAIEANHP